MGIKRLIQNTMIIVLGAAIIVMSVGYAVFNTEISYAIPNSANKIKWDVHFENPTKLNATTVLNEFITLPELNEETTSLSFKAKLTVGDIYQFSVDIRNAGNFVAKLQDFTWNVTKNGAETFIVDEAEANSNLQYSLKWEDGTPLVLEQELYRNDLKTLIITVKVVDPMDGTIINYEAEDYEFNLDLNYVKK